MNRVIMVATVFMATLVVLGGLVTMIRDVDGVVGWGLAGLYVTMLGILGAQVFPPEDDA